MVGHLPKLTPEVQATIVNYVRAGAYIETAAAAAGISKDSFYRWMRRGAREKQRVEKILAEDETATFDEVVNEEERRYVEFVDAVEKALAEAELRDLLVIGQAAKAGAWQAAAWRLERKFPERWGRRDRLEVEGKLERQEHDVTTRIIADPELYSMAEEILRKVARVESKNK